MRTKAVVTIIAFCAPLALAAAACGGGSSGSGDTSGATQGAGASGGGGASAAGGSTSTTGGAGGMAAGGANGSCSTDGDCPTLATQPPGCAVAKCDSVTKKCSYSPRDADGDHHPDAKCASVGATVLQMGDDCDDGDPTTYPGAWDGPGVDGHADRCDRKDQDCNQVTDDAVGKDGTSCTCMPHEKRDCAADANGNPIVFPTGKPLGACRRGTQECVMDSTQPGHWGACVGAVGPAQFDSCTVGGNDENCNGTPNEGCDCKDDAPPRPCDATAQGTIISWPKVDQDGNPSGICKRGTQKCSGGKWGICTGAVAPATRACKSSADNDCDGSADNTHDAVCACQTKDDTSCSGPPPGNCQGTRQCLDEGSKSEWSSCQAPSSCSCTSGATQPCAANVCAGTQTCVAGSWSLCAFNNVPLPGDCQCTAAVSCATIDPANPCGTKTCSPDFKLTGACGPNVTYCPDADGDGYGSNKSPPQSACAVPSGSVANCGDCDDTPTTGLGIHPGATEVCNGIDDNCAGGTDEGNPGGSVTCVDGDNCPGSHNCDQTCTVPNKICGGPGQSIASNRCGFGCTETCSSTCTGVSACNLDASVYRVWTGTDSALGHAPGCGYDKGNTRWHIDKDQPTCLMQYGPYQPLPRGEYKWHVALAVTGNDGGGCVDLTVTQAGSSTPLDGFVTQTPCFGAGSQDVTMDFTIGTECQSIELYVEYHSYPSYKSALEIVANEIYCTGDHCLVNTGP